MPDELVGPPRCGVTLHVREGRTSQLRPGNYPCTQPAGHDKARTVAGQNVPPSPHTSVVAWAEVPG